MTRNKYSEHDWLVDLESRLNGVEEELSRITSDNALAGRKPYQCPLCVGIGKGELVHNDYCNACDGKGIVWG